MYGHRFFCRPNASLPKTRSKVSPIHGDMKINATRMTDRPRTDQGHSNRSGLGRSRREWNYDMYCNLMGRPPMSCLTFSQLSVAALTISAEARFPVQSE